MAVQFIGATSLSSTAGGNITLTLPGNYRSSDCAIVAVSLGTTQTPTLSVASSSGATSLYTQIVATLQSSNVRFGVFRRILGSTAETQITIAGSGTAGDGVASVVHIFRGVNTTTPEDVTPQSTQANNIAPKVLPLVPASFGDGIVTSVGFSYNIANTTPPASALNVLSTGALAGTNGCGVAQAWIENGSTNTSTSATWSSTGGTRAWAAGTEALRPAGITWSEAGMTSAEGLVVESRRVILKSY